MPAGWGYSYLDWIGAYSFALAMLGAAVPPRPHRRGPVDRRVAVRDRDLHRRHRRCSTGRPTAASGPATATARRTSRRRRTAPTAAAGEDRWIAIACFTEDEWRALVEVAGRPRAGSTTRASPRSRRGSRTRTTLDARRRGLDRRVRTPTTAMAALQAAGVPAGVCQTAEDRCDAIRSWPRCDWLTEVTGTKIGTLAGGRGAGDAERHARATSAGASTAARRATARTTSTSYGAARARRGRGRGPRRAGRDLMAPRGAAMRGRTAIVGVGATAQGEHPGLQRRRSRARRAARLALADGGLDKAAVDGLITCRSNGRLGVDTRDRRDARDQPALQRHARLRHLQLLAAPGGDGDRGGHGETVASATAPTSAASGATSASPPRAATSRRRIGLVHIAGPAAMALRRHSTITARPRSSSATSRSPSAHGRSSIRWRSSASR